MVSNINPLQGHNVKGIPRPISHPDIIQVVYKWSQKIPLASHISISYSLLFKMHHLHFNFKVMDNDLLITVLDVTAIKAIAKCCFCCSTFDHE